MTNEEKAKEYINKKLCSLCREEKSKTKCATCPTFLTAYTCHLDGLVEGRKEGYEQGILKDCIKVACPNCKPSADNYCIGCEYANLIIDKDNQIYNLEKEIAELKAKFDDFLFMIQDKTKRTLLKENAELKEQIEKMSCENKYVVSDDNSQAVPCYTVYDCKHCSKRS